VEHGEKADLGPQVLGISADGEQGLRSGAEQDAVEFPLVLIGNRCNLFWYGEDHVEVLGVQQLGLTILEPLSPGKRLAFWAVAIRAGNGELSITCIGLNRFAVFRSATSQE
jgi:hypothetical protein